MHCQGDTAQTAAQYGKGQHFIALIMKFGAVAVTTQVSLILLDCTGAQAA